MNDSQLSPRVLILTLGLGVGGLERMVLNLALFLKKIHGVEIRVIAYDHPEQDNSPELTHEFQKNGIDVKTFNKSRGFSPGTVLLLIKEIIKYDIQVIHSHDLGSLIYASMVKIMLLGKVKLVHTQHSFFHLADHRRYRLYERLFSRMANELTAVSESLKDQYIELGLPADKVKVIVNGADFVKQPLGNREEQMGLRRQLIQGIENPARRSPLEKCIQDYWVLYLARLHSIKGQDNAVRLWQQLDEIHRKK